MSEECVGVGLQAKVLRELQEKVRPAKRFVENKGGCLEYRYRLPYLLRNWLWFPFSPDFTAYFDAIANGMGSGSELEVAAEEQGNPTNGI